MKIQRFKIFELVMGGDSNFPFKDDKIKIHQVKNGPNRGKIGINFIDQNQKYAYASGCAKLLDTEYEHKPELRNVQINNKFKKITPFSIEVILRDFLLDMGYVEVDNKSNIENVFWVGSDVMTILKDKFEDDFKELENSRNLGDVMDGLRKIRDEVFEFQREHFEEWEMNRNAKKYNL